MNVVEFPNPLLKLKSEDIDPTKEPNFVQTVDEMIETMRNEEGVGLAAIQVGMPKNFFVYDDSRDQNDARVICNPVIVEESEVLAEAEEGCLSFPGLYFPVTRPEKVIVEGIDAAGNPVRIEGDEFLSRIMQHEIDHLRGKVILDRATPEIRREVLRKFYAG